MLEEGDLAGAYKMYQQASAIEHEIGGKNFYASTLTQMGRVLRQQANAGDAQQAYRDSLFLEEELGNKSDAAETRLALADLDCDSGKGTEAPKNSVVPRSRRFVRMLTPTRRSSHNLCCPEPFSNKER